MFDDENSLFYFILFTKMLASKYFSFQFAKQNDLNQNKQGFQKQGNKQKLNESNVCFFVWVQFFFSSVFVLT